MVRVFRRAPRHLARSRRPDNDAGLGQAETKLAGEDSPEDKRKPIYWT